MCVCSPSPGRKGGERPGRRLTAELGGRDPPHSWRTSCFLRTSARVVRYHGRRLHLRVPRAPGDRGSLLGDDGDDAVVDAASMGRRRRVTTGEAEGAPGEKPVGVAWYIGRSDTVCQYHCQLTPNPFNVHWFPFNFLFSFFSFFFCLFLSFPFVILRLSGGPCRSNHESSLPKLVRGATL